MNNLYEEVSFREIAKVIDGSTFDCGFVSISPSSNSTRVDLVVGAEFKYKCSSVFSKTGLGKLIEQLQVVHSLMKDY